MMLKDSEFWDLVAKKLITFSDNTDGNLALNQGQRANLRAIAQRIPNNGVIIADGVGMGKTRIAAVVANCVIAAGGRVAILAPPGLGFQWREALKDAKVEVPLILRSLGQYLEAWKGQDAYSSKPWFNEKAVLISHSFSILRGSKKIKSWRWALLPMLVAHWKKQTKRRFPNGYKSSHDLASLAAENIVASIHTDSNHPERNWMEQLVGTTRWNTASNAGEYVQENADNLRPKLEHAVGLGLGTFDLIIVDEAHKSRGQFSGLNRLLDGVILPSKVARRIAITATPIEIDAVKQWEQMLKRINVGSVPMTAIQNYVDTARKVQQCVSDAQSRINYTNAAQNFKTAFDPYLLRRDKREEQCIKDFTEHSGEEMHAYRHKSTIRIPTSKLKYNWKRAICAAEALSLVVRQSDNTLLKRLRLTLGNGHGISALIDNGCDIDDGDAKQNKADSDANAPKKNKDVKSTPEHDGKLLKRAKWWRKIMVKPFLPHGTNGSLIHLFEHPAILKAVKKIEKVCGQGEKVLVFGRFTQPMKALVQLLNARAMLLSLKKKIPWPQSKIPDSEWGAVQAAHGQMKQPGQLIREEIDKKLSAQYRKLEQQRRSFRNALLDKIDAGLGQGLTTKSRTRALFDAFKNETTEPGKTSDDHCLSFIAQAILENVGIENASASPEIIASAFVDLVNAASDSDSDEVKELNKKTTSNLWTAVKENLREEYSHPQSSFARLMNGATKPQTRRFLQLAFNRGNSHTKVLVAQSIVGREGLNLHEACRTVVLLHPEWNPGVVEQQIGRVDRMNSLWESMLKEALQSNTALPKIEFHPVVFQGTYDEENWRVLRERWDDLRAQLHGIVISPELAKKYTGFESEVREINDAAPNFSPSKHLPCTKKPLSA